MFTGKDNNKRSALYKKKPMYNVTVIELDVLRTPPLYCDTGSHVALEGAPCQPLRADCTGLFRT